MEIASLDTHTWSECGKHCESHLYPELLLSPFRAMCCNSIFTIIHTLIATSRRTVFFAVAFIGFLFFFWLARFPDDRPHISQAWLTSSTETFPTSVTLGVARRLYMITLPTRKDRRIRMEALRKTLGLQWTYVDGLQSTNELTQRIWEWVLRVRDGQPIILSDHDSSLGHPGTVKFSWPDDIDQLAQSSVPIDFWSDTVWSTPGAVLNITPYRPTGCAVQNYRILDFNSSLPEHLVLSRARIACWYSHVSVIHTIANNKDKDFDSAYIILEDDIDMEKDTIQQLKILWTSLPKGWDMVFLGTSTLMD